MNDEAADGQAHHRPGTCDVCGRRRNRLLLRPWSSVRPAISELIKADVPAWSDGQFICREDLGRYRRRYVEQGLEAERGELTKLDHEVLDSLESGQPLSQNPEEMHEEQASFADSLSDRIAEFGGSWTFILSFLGVLAVWMLLNVTGWLFKPFDIYPFILLNLALSCVAALQAPVIMMSQRRQETKDRLRAENDYRINLKAELEIRQLHEKLDYQLARHWERLSEMQQLQIELLEDRAAGRAGD